jgi:Terminase large subunit, T4likevirus-type, N-terminal
LLKCPVPDVLFGGARGGGKSDALLGDWVAHASRANGWGRGIIFRRTMPELEELIARSRQLYTPLGAEWFTGRKTWEFPCGANLKMRWLDRDQDADRYQGHQYTYIGVDEVGTWPDPAPMDKLRATLRTVHRIPCVMRATANPGGVGQGWINERYIKPSAPGVPFYDKLRRVWRVFIPSKLKNNRILMDADPDYENRLRSSGPPWLVKAWLDGDWNASAGQSYFLEDAFLVDKQPVDYPRFCDSVVAVMDTAVKTGSGHDGTAVSYWAYSSRVGIPLVLLEWDILQIEGALLEKWIEGVFLRLEELSASCKARYGSVGAYIEDAASGAILLQQCALRGLPATPLPSELTAAGKDARALNAGPQIYRGNVKFSRHAYEKTMLFKGETRNHMLSQVCGFKLGDKDAGRRADDLLDTLTYAVAITLGNQEGIG